jgi:hypothetical protein
MTLKHAHEDGHGYQDRLKGCSPSRVGRKKHLLHEMYEMAQYLIQDGVYYPRE